MYYRTVFVNEVFLMIKKLRFNIPSVGKGPVEGQGIIVLIKYDQIHPLALMVDEQGNNHGASLTNSVDTVIAYVEKMTGISHVAMRYVELDSEGHFDEVIISGSSDSRTHFIVNWRPLQSGQHSRTLEAFKAKHGIAALELMTELISTLGLNRSPILNNNLPNAFLRLA
jgi:hypothetical protein